MNVALHYNDSGGEGEPLLVIHGLLGSADNWRSHVRQWQKHYRVIALDLRNHGRSFHAPGMSYEAMAADVFALMDNLNIEKAHLLGHSMGGKVVMSVARLAPERVHSLIVADIAPVTYGHGHDNVFAALRSVEAGQPADRPAADALMAEYVPERAVRLFLATNLVRSDQGGLCLRLGLDEIQAGYEDIIGLPAGEEAFDGPALVIRGSRSAYVLDEWLPAVYAVLPRAEVVTLDAGHWLHAEQPDAFQHSVNKFLASLDD